MNENRLKVTPVETEEEKTIEITDVEKQRLVCMLVHLRGEMAVIEERLRPLQDAINRHKECAASVGAIARSLGVPEGLTWSLADTLDKITYTQIHNASPAGTPPGGPNGSE